MGPLSAEEAYRRGYIGQNLYADLQDAGRYLGASADFSTEFFARLVSAEQAGVLDSSFTNTTLHEFGDLSRSTGSFTPVAVRLFMERPALYYAVGSTSFNPAEITEPGFFSDDWFWSLPPNHPSVFFAKNPDGSRKKYVLLTDQSGSAGMPTYMIMTEGSTGEVVWDDFYTTQEPELSEILTHLFSGESLDDLRHEKEIPLVSASGRLAEKAGNRNLACEYLSMVRDENRFQLMHAVEGQPQRELLYGTLSKPLSKGEGETGNPLKARVFDSLKWGDPGVYYEGLQKFVIIPDGDPVQGDYLVLTKNLERQVVVVHFSSTREVPAPTIGLRTISDRVTTLDDLRGYHRMVIANPGQVHEIVDKYWARSVDEVQATVHPMRPKTIYHLTPVPMSVPDKPIAARVLFYTPREYGLQAHGRAIKLPAEQKSFTLPFRPRPSVVAARPEKLARPPRVTSPAGAYGSGGAQPAFVERSGAARADALVPAVATVAPRPNSPASAASSGAAKQIIPASEITASTPAASLRAEGGMQIAREPLPIRLQWNAPIARRAGETFRNLMTNPVAETRATIWWGEDAAPLSYAVARDGAALLLTSDTGNIYLERKGHQVSLRVANPRSALGQWLEEREAGSSWQEVETGDGTSASIRPTHGNGTIPENILVEVVVIDAEVAELHGMYRSYLPSHLTLLETAIQETNEMIAIATLPQDVALIEETLRDFEVDIDAVIYVSKSHGREWSLRQFLSLMAHNGGWDRPLVLQLAHAIEGYDTLVQQIDAWKNPPPDGPGGGVEKVREDGDVVDAGDVEDTGDVEWGDEDNVVETNFEAPRNCGRNAALYGAASTWATSPAALRTLLKAA